jgi:hypothetical protein
LSLLEIAMMFWALEFFSCHDLVALTACDFNMSTIHFQMEEEILKRRKCFLTVFADSALWTIFFHMLVQLRNCHLYLNFFWIFIFGSFFILWITIVLDNFRLLFTNMSFSHVLNFIEQFCWHFSKLKFFLTWETLGIRFFSKLTLAWKTENFSAMFAFFQIKWSLLALETWVVVL